MIRCMHVCSDMPSTSRVKLLQQAAPHTAQLSLLCYLAGPITLSGLAVRLVGGSTPAAGRLEVLREAQWASVSAMDAASRPAIASVACQELGLGGTNTSLPVVKDPAAFGTSGTSKWLNVSSCNSNEFLVQDCQCAYLYTSASTGKVYSVVEQCTSGSVTLLPSNTSGMEAGQLAMTCPTSAGVCLGLLACLSACQASAANGD